MKDVKTIAIKKAMQSQCRFKVSAVGFDNKGKLIGTTMNAPRFSKYGGGFHAEMRLMARYGKNLKTIVICRVGNKGDMLPIDPCKMCQNKANELGIKIVTLGNN
jgi:cytidine deaminase